MNQQNAQSIGYSDGKKRLQGWIASGKPFTKEEFLSNLDKIALYSYGVRSLKTVDLFVAGQADAWQSYEQEQAREQAEAARRAAIQHNPNTRFCTCAACREG